MPLNVVTVVQARMLSTRLPGKVLLPVLGEPLLLHQLRRVRAAATSGTIVVATTTAPADDPIVQLCRQHDFHVFRGHPTDLLDRHVQAGRRHQADVVVKIPSDCPLIDPSVVDRVIGSYLAEPGAYDYVSNLHPATYPDGNDVEVMRSQALEIAWQEADRALEREHTTPFLWERPARFRLHNVSWETGLDYSMSHRWTIDYEADFQFIEAVFSALYPQNALFSLADILQLLGDRPDIAALNARYAGVNWYRDHLSELKTVTPEQTRQPRER